MIDNYYPDQEIKDLCEQVQKVDACWHLTQSAIKRRERKRAQADLNAALSDLCDALDNWYLGSLP